MRHWTATITLYGSDDGLSYSVAWYRPGVPVGRYQRPHKRLTGRLRPTATGEPRLWLRSALQGLEKQI